MLFSIQKLWMTGMFSDLGQAESTVTFIVEKNGKSELRGACSPTLSSSLNDVCCSGNALMWEIAVVCSMWQIIRHANQVEAAVESLIMVWVPHKGTSPHRTDPPGAPPDSGSLPLLHIHPHSPAALVPPRQTDGPEAEALRREESLGRIGWYGWFWHLGWSGFGGQIFKYK